VTGPEELLLVSSRLQGYGQQSCVICIMTV